MVVQHNLTAMNSNRMLNITTKSQAKATEKLSSGYKINRAADDAAGLSISEKMRKQIRGLTQASSNAQDGISAVQTAEGALTEVHDMLQRMNELAVKAANGTNSEDDRAYIQAEVDQLVTEIDRVSTTTKFNETYLLKGDHGDGTGTLSFTTAEGNIGNKIQGSNGTDSITFDNDGIATIALTTAAKISATYQTLSWNSGASSTDSGNVNSTTSTFDGQTLKIGDKEFYLYQGATEKALTDVAKSANGSADAVLTESTVTVDHTGDFKATEAAKLNKTEADTATDNKKYFFTDKDKFISALKDELGNLGLAEDVKSLKIDSDGTVTITAFSDLNKGLDISLHVGADSTKDNKIGLTIEMMSARGLGINGLKVDGATDANATASIDIIKAAIQKVSEQRSALGAVQNRLEHTIANLDNIVENTQSAESAIRDTDMATQMVAYSNNNILAQAGQAMLAQANQSNQGVMSLLQ